MTAALALSGCSKTTEPDLRDVLPPAQITDLRAKEVTSSRVYLEWTAPGDDGNTGRASGYRVRFSRSEITQDNWDETRSPLIEASLVTSPAGQTDSISTRLLSSSTVYYFAIRSLDEVGNLSAVSNNCRVETQPQECLEYVSKLYVEETSIFTVNPYGSSTFLVGYSRIAWDYSLDTKINAVAFSYAGGREWLDWEVPASGWKAGSVPVIDQDRVYLLATEQALLPTESPRLYIHHAPPGDQSLGMCVVGNVSSGPYFNRSITLLNNHVFYGDADGCLGVVDVSNVSSPHWLKSDTCLGIEVAGVRSCGSHLLAWERKFDGKVVLADVTDINNITVVSQFTLPESIEGLDVTGNMICLLESDEKLTLVDVSNPSEPVQRGSRLLSSSTSSLAAKDQFVYTVDPDLDMVDVFNVSNPDTVVHQTSYDIADMPRLVFASDSYVFVVEGGPLSIGHGVLILRRTD